MHRSVQKYLVLFSLKCTNLLAKFCRRVPNFETRKPETLRPQCFLCYCCSALPSRPRFVKTGRANWPLRRAPLHYRLGWRYVAPTTAWGSMRMPPHVPMNANLSPAEWCSAWLLVAIRHVSIINGQIYLIIKKDVGFKSWNEVKLTLFHFFGTVSKLFIFKS